MKGIRKSLQVYWEAYGGWQALFKSGYFWMAVGLTVILHLYRPERLRAWEELSLNIVPSLLGFTLGGYALLIGVGDSTFRDAIRGPDSDGTPSPFMVANAAFVHFLLLQFCALISSVVINVFEIKSCFVDIVGMWLMLYALLSVVAAVLALLNLASWYDKSPKSDSSKNSEQENGAGVENETGPV